MSENTIIKYFLLLKFTIHPQFAGHATYKNANTINLAQTHLSSKLKQSITKNCKPTQTKGWWFYKQNYLL